MTRLEIRQELTVRFAFPILFTRGAFHPSNPVLAGVFREAGPQRHRVLPVVDAHLLEARPGLCDELARYAEAHAERLELVAPPVALRGGEACKGDPADVDRLHALIERHHLCRQSFVLAVGGGAVLDAAGFAAATAHRGLRLLRMPTTVLAQNDAGVGVKNGINAFGRKNFLGTFAPPFAVVNDFDFVDALPEREKRAGLSEAVKVALIKDRAFFDYLEAHREALRRFEPAALEHAIVRCAELHSEHIATSGDPFEFGSARPLDFGHWSAHKLEELTGGRLRHGEAVAVGLALDSLYSLRAGRVGEDDLERIFAVLEGLGFALWHPALGDLDVGRALEEFREHLGGELTITLLRGLGGREEVHDLDVGLLRRCIGDLAERFRGAA